MIMFNNNTGSVLHITLYVSVPLNCGIYTGYSWKDITGGKRMISYANEIQKYMTNIFIWSLIFDKVDFERSYAYAYVQLKQNTFVCLHDFYKLLSLRKYISSRNMFSTVFQFIN